MNTRQSPAGLAPTRQGEAGTLRLTTAQALVRYLAALRGRDADSEESAPLFGGVFAIFGHGNVAGLGEALYGIRDELPTYRAHNEQAMAHAAIAYAKANMRRRMMAVTTSIGPGATNLVTAAALAHVNRLPVLLLPGDIFVSRAPDPVLQQLEDFSDGTVSVNDCFRPVSRYFDRIVRPEQLLTALPRAIRALTDPALCGPVTLALPQDVQAEAYDWPAAFFEPREVVFRAPQPTDDELLHALDAIETAERPVIVAGGGALYAKATPELLTFADKHGVPVCETQAGKGALPWNHPLHLGPAGVCGSTAANALLRDADLIIAVGTRLQDFTTGSNALFAHVPILSINVNTFDTLKGNGLEVVGDAAQVLDDLSFGLEEWAAPEAWSLRAREVAAEWVDIVSRITDRRQPPEGRLPYDGEVIGAVQRSSSTSAQGDIVVCAAGTLPAELEKLWRTETPGGYHMEYGYSCMGYEIAGALGVKLARPEREVYALAGDGSYLMLSQELLTAIEEGAKITVVLVGNHGSQCRHNLQRGSGGRSFGNDFRARRGGRLDGEPLAVDFVKNAESLGARTFTATTAGELARALGEARGEASSCLLYLPLATSAPWP
ncbi:MAG: 3D-(3,5/4)-trihydroxycyclohexane-1,2-dione acylhydrolase (decyclizing), partial [Rhizobacter sp.]